MNKRRESMKKKMEYTEEMLALTDMVSASSRLSIGIAGLVYTLLPKKDLYKVQVLIEAHNDALDLLALNLNKGEGHGY